jgi:hypothetical protein
MPRFVLLYHDCPPGYVRPSHWDLMLEAGDVLETWALAQLPRDWQAAHERTAATHPHCPPLAAGNAVPAERLPDHRIAYLDYEGPVSGDRGNVVRVAVGAYTTTTRRDDCVQIELRGDLSGRVALEHTAPDSPAWLLAARP